jgi:hypothetical protein
VPPEHQDQVGLELGVHGANVTIFELRPRIGQETGAERVRQLRPRVVDHNAGDAGRQSPDQATLATTYVDHRVSAQGG